jgi:hypothetical protein
MRPVPVSKAADYRRQAKEIRAVAAQISLLDTRRQLLDTARHLEALAVDEERREAAPKLVAGDANPTA